ncbi:hypothetical protein SEA_BEUFFERT_244 [Streptomyces phage Beuffert]|nr:hypothetical protein SEA_BEUFFERT_244 [Streptomyces phage Beuffert]
MFWRKKKAAPRDITGFTFDIRNYPAGSKSYHISIESPNGESLFWMDYGFPSTTKIVKAKSPEDALDKGKQYIYDMLAADELSNKNSINITY